MRRTSALWLVLWVFNPFCQGRLAGQETIQSDLLIVGGTESGCAAAVQAARMGVRSIAMVNDIAWLGGQFSSESLVAIDENRGPEGYGHGVPFPRSGLFREVIDAIEAENLHLYGRARPGNTRVITTCRPAVAQQAFRRLLRPYVESGQVRIFENYYPVEAKLDDASGALCRVSFRSTSTDQPSLIVNAGMTIDASDWGDVIKVAGAAHEFGPDLQEEYGEPLAPTSRDDYPSTDMNPITYGMVVVETDRYEPIPEPPGYDARNYQNHAYPEDPLWLYESRRLVDHYTYQEIDHPDVLLLCFPAFDYPLDVLPKQVADALEATESGASEKNIVQMTREQRQIVFDDAKQYSLGFLYYLQTAVHDQMPDKTHSFRRFQLSDEFATPDRMPPKPYVRESLRLRAQYMMRQQDTAGHGGIANHFATSMYHDGVACWQFEYDFHPTGRKFLDEGDPAGPWTNYFRPGRTWGPPYSGRCLFPLRSLVPEKIDGLLGAQKNLGYSSIVSSAVRLHDQSMAIGQAAGAVAAVSLKCQVQPRAISYDRSLLGRVWEGLCARRDGGQPQMLWPFHDIEPDHPAFEAVNLLAVRGGLPLDCFQVDFHPEQPASPAWREAVAQRSLATKQVSGDSPDIPRDPMTRGQFARLWWQRIRDLPDRPLQRLSQEDADLDGVPDTEDALPFDARPSSWPEFKPPADADGIPDDIETKTDAIRRFNFTGEGSPAVDGFTNDEGRIFDAVRGYGWSHDLRPSHRRRGRAEQPYRDTFLFTRSHDVWELAVPHGRYRVTVCIGDSGYDQFGQNVTVEGEPYFRDHETSAGWFAEKSAEVMVRDGRLSVEIGLPESTTNTCLNWLQIEPVQGDEERPVGPD